MPLSVFDVRETHVRERAEPCAGRPGIAGDGIGAGLTGLLPVRYNYVILYPYYRN